MHFFLYEIVARVVAAYLFVDCFHKLRQAFVDRKIQDYNPDLLNWWSHGLVDRNSAPVVFWINVVLRTLAMASCLAVAIFGWFQTSA